MREYLGRIVDIKIDKPIGSKNSEHGFFYPANYGYLENGKKIETYVLGEFEALEKFRGRVIAIIKRKDTNEEVLVVTKRLLSFNKTDIEVLTEFQERYYDIEITCASSRASKPYIRVTTLGLARRNDDILVTEAIDGIAEKIFYRLPGGGVEFREESEETIKREFLEELNADIVSTKYLDKIENIFEFEEEKKHELILLYEVELPEKFYQKDEITIDENGIIGRALWINKNNFLKEDKTIHPIEIKKYL